jgi:5-methylcytosine-specific restriction enzyme subunit McrC
MLKTVKHVNGKSFKMAHLNVSRNNILEIFIAMFLTEVDTIIKRGIKSSYVTIQSNEKFLKGKILMTQHIRKNTVNQSSFYNEYDEFLANGPENQIIKSTLEFLLTKSRSSVNQRLIREQLTHFELVDTTGAHEQAFQKVQGSRYYKYYDQALEWAKVFLSRKSFTSFKGNSIAFAILFPMEEIFEAYIAQLLKRNLQNVRVSAQDKRYFLFDKTLKTRANYRLRPDLVIRHSGSAQTTIADTKWKVLDKNGPSQSDLYQMYAYYTRYQHRGEPVDRVMLLYPYTEAYQEAEFRSLMQQSGNEELSAKIQVSFIDLLSDDETVEKQLTDIFN